MNARRVATLVVMAALALAAGAAVWQSLPAHQPTVASVAAGLRCPTCEGESVADSRSPVAAGMREVIAAQLAEGRKPDEIRAWFADRYGAEVLDLPSGAGPGALLWILPAAVLAAGLVLAWRAARRSRAHPEPPAGGGAERRPPVRTRRMWELAALGLLAMVAAIALAGNALRGPGDAAADPAAAASPAADPVAAELALARSLEEAGEYAAAAESYQSVYDQRPDDAALRLRLAFTLLRADQPEQALPLARDAVAAQPEQPEPLLILGLAQRATGSPEAEQTLRRFLAAAPDHPTAAEVRRLLDP